MKKLTVFCAAMFALAVSGELLAQTRGPRYNPGGGGGGGSRSSGGGGGSSRSSSGGGGGSSRSSGSSSGSSSRGPSYNPSRSSSSSSSSSSPSRSSGSSSSSSSPSRSSGSSSSSSSSTPRGPSYNPNPGSSSSSSSSGSTHTPSTPSSSSSSSSSSPSPRGPSYNPNPSSNPAPTSGTVQAPRGPRYNPSPSTIRIPTHQQQNPGAILVRRTFNHVPRVVVGGPVRWQYPHDYYAHVNRRFIYRSWLQEPVGWNYNNGYWDIDGYPYYVHRGYRYRYSPVEMCQYELVDGETYDVVKTYPVEACTAAYDTCAVERDTMNRTVAVERYFCAERVDADQVQQPTEVFQAGSVELTEVQKAAIAAFLEDMDFKDIFDAVRDDVGNCSIQKNGGLFSRGNQFDCRWSVKVGDKNFPLTDGSICSDDNSADAVGCNIGNEKENAGCILQQAIQTGLCL